MRSWGWFGTDEDGDGYTARRSRVGDREVRCACSAKTTTPVRRITPSKTSARYARRRVDDENLSSSRANANALPHLFRGSSPGAASYGYFALRLDGA
mmetsp:Transcript_8157/g.34082  ORF Transcript_8157/g.34082 Transcript_8157/m.34082 type:complete len:97 (+) Transcript_8157:398-688(+)